jgi:hypothetical protein
LIRSRHRHIAIQSTLVDPKHSVDRWEKYLEIAERSELFSPQMIVPSVTMFRKATVAYDVDHSLTVK